MQQKCCIAAEAPWVGTGHATTENRPAGHPGGLGAGKAPRPRGTLVVGLAATGLSSTMAVFPVANRKMSPFVLLSLPAGLSAQKRRTDLPATTSEDHDGQQH
jgi:hypothetical protein